MAEAALSSATRLTAYWWDRVAAARRCPTPRRRPRRTWSSSARATPACAPRCRPRGAGAATVVLDAEDAGWGCSTRNGGQISTSVKPGYDAN